MNLQDLPGYFDANCFMQDFIANPNFSKGVERIKKAALENDESFLASILVQAYLGSTPVSDG